MFISNKYSTIHNVHKNHKTSSNRFATIEKSNENVQQPIWRQNWFPWIVGLFGFGILVGIVIMVYFLIKRYIQSKTKNNLEISHNNTLMKLLRNDVAHSSLDIPYDWMEINIDSNITYDSTKKLPTDDKDQNPLFYNTKHFHSAFVQPTSSPGQAFYKGTDKTIITLTPQLLNFSSVQTRRRQKGLLENRRGSPGSLTLSLSPSVDSVACTNSSPLADKKRLESASLFLSADQLIERANSLDNVELCFQEFWNIPMNYANRDELSITGIGMKNRFETIIPNEATRVRLPQINSDVLSTYINANYIRGYKDAPRAFIATQGPLPTTLVDFWRMVWHCKSKSIVMVTKVIEANKKTCEWYLPTKVNETVQFGDIKIELMEIIEKSGYNIYELIIQNVITLEKRDCRHFWFCSWPDQKIPDNLSSSFVQIEHIADGCQKDSTGPIIVHCSAGVGRTGCFIAFCIGKEQLLIEGGVDILRIVSHIRLDRGGCVQYNEQYQFLYESLAVLAKQHSPLPKVDTTHKTSSSNSPIICKNEYIHGYPLSAGRIDSYRRSRINAFDFDETVEDVSISTGNSP